MFLRRGGRMALGDRWVSTADMAPPVPLQQPAAATMAGRVSLRQAHTCAA
jgi:hypothetical protein